MAEVPLVSHALECLCELLHLPCPELSFVLVGAAPWKPGITAGGRRYHHYFV